MAGDWIKMRTNIGTDPAVIRIGLATGLDSFAVVGRLHALWAWADTHTANGFAPGVSVPWLSRFLSHDGFAEALVSVGWLEVVGDGVSIPNFDRHMGQAAKKRVTESERKRTYRAKLASRPKRDSVPKVVPLEAGHCPEKSGTREEKRREEDKDPPKPPAKPGGGECEEDFPRSETKGPTVAEVVAAWNAQTGLIPALPSDPSRDRIIRHWATGVPLWAEHWRDVILYVGRTTFYTGGGPRGWKADLGWLFKESNFQKALERMRAAAKPPPRPQPVRYNPFAAEENDSGIGAMILWAKDKKQGGGNAAA